MISGLLQESIPTERPIAVKCLIRNEKGQILLVKIAYAHKQWTLPGGGIETGESPAQAAIRELKEESGISVSSLRSVGTCPGSKPKPHVIECFEGKTNDHPRVMDPGEIEKVAWFSMDNLPPDRAPKVDVVLKEFIGGL